MSITVIRSNTEHTPTTIIKAKSGLCASYITNTYENLNRNIFAVKNNSLLPANDKNYINIRNKSQGGLIRATKFGGREGVSY